MTHGSAKILKVDHVVRAPMQRLFKDPVHLATCIVLGVVIAGLGIVLRRALLEKERSRFATIERVVDTNVRS